MEKIPTLFRRDDDGKVIDIVADKCQWVLAGIGQATEKLDGINIRLTIRAGTCVRLEKRRNPTKKQKAAGIVKPWYVDANRDDPADKHIFSALDGTDLSNAPDGEWTCEAIGPSIQGNPLQLDSRRCVPHIDAPVFPNVPRDYSSLRKFLEKLESLYSPGNLAEGIVFLHPIGWRAKIKRKDFFR